jgi:hypothetical protein
LGCNYFAGLPYRFITLYAKTCYALASFTALPVFPGFLPKLFCGRSTANIFQAKSLVALKMTAILDLPNTYAHSPSK